MSGPGWSAQEDGNYGVHDKRGQPLVLLGLLTRAAGGTADAAAGDDVQFTSDGERGRRGHRPPARVGENAARGGDGAT